jgi:hypothetical protein
MPGRMDRWHKGCLPREGWQSRVRIRGPQGADHLGQGFQPLCGAGGAPGFAVPLPAGKRLACGAVGCRQTGAPWGGQRHAGAVCQAPSSRPGMGAVCGKAAAPSAYHRGQRARVQVGQASTTRSLGGGAPAPARANDWHVCVTGTSSGPPQAGSSPFFPVQCTSGRGTSPGAPVRGAQAPRAGPG